MEDFKLKNVYSHELVTRFAALLQKIYPLFQRNDFVQSVLDTAWEYRELKERMRHITAMLRQFLPPDYAEAIQILRQAAPQCEGFPYLFFPDFVEQYGLGDEKISIPALELFTQFSSAEFAVRPFIVNNPDKIMAQMLVWAEHPHHHVRRLASEGSRPRLPWGMALKQFQRDPSPVLPILERLKTDESDYVRRSVANNLNDIAKDHPSLVVEIAKRWKGANPHTDWIVRHGLRTLLRRGNREALALFDLHNAEGVRINNLYFATDSLTIGAATTFSFEIHTAQAMNIRLEYGVYYVKANGEAIRKVFFIHEKEYPENSTATIVRKISFVQRTTRKHYAGVHRLFVIVNGIECAETSLMLTA
jgi:3-methyladenine DNA glycosylase AlkC